jgi:hypothetical protein
MPQRRDRRRVRDHLGLLRHVVGGVAIELDGNIAALTARQPRLARHDESPITTIRLTAVRTAGPLRPSGGPVAEYDTWAAFLDGDWLRVCNKIPGRTPLEAMRLELRRDALEGRYVYDDDDWPYIFQHPFDQLLTVHVLSMAGGALMHAAAITGRDGGFLVAGMSGAGKTTLSRACAAIGARILSDERATVRRIADGSWLLGGTPWPGEGGFKENRSVPLRGLILLEQSDRDELVPVSPARALALLYRCHFPPPWDPVAAERTLAHLERLVSEVPAFLFKNRKGPAAAQMVLERLGGVA